MLYRDAPFELGETLQGTDDNSNLINDHWLGATFEIPASALDQAQIRGSKKRNCGRPLKGVILRNTSGLTLYGKRLVALDTTAGYAFLKNVTGYSTAKLQSNVVIVDEFLASDGVADDDIFWGILEGPVTVRTANSNMVELTVGAKLSAGSGTTSQASATAGGVEGVAAPTADDLIGTALSAKTTDETGEDVLINATIKLW